MQVLLGEEAPKLAGRGASRVSLDTYDLLERVAAAQAPFWPDLVRFSVTYLRFTIVLQFLAALHCCWRSSVKECRFFHGSINLPGNVQPSDLVIQG